jgi:DNA-binding transcriptional MerR regulator
MGEKRFSIKEAANIIGRSPITIKKWAQQELIQSKYNDKGHLYYTKADILQMLDIKKTKREIMLSGGVRNDGKSSSDKDSCPEN